MNELTKAAGRYVLHTVRAAADDWNAMDKFLTEELGEQPSDVQMAYVRGLAQIEAGNLAEKYGR
jgi:hypothetical protein